MLLLFQQQNFVWCKIDDLKFVTPCNFCIQHLRESCDVTNFMIWQILWEKNSVFYNSLDDKFPKWKLKCIITVKMNAFRACWFPFFHICICKWTIFNANNRTSFIHFSIQNIFHVFVRAHSCFLQTTFIIHISVHFHFIAQQTKHTASKIWNWLLWNFQIKVNVPINRRSQCNTKWNVQWKSYHLLSTISLHILSNLLISSHLRYPKRKSRNYEISSHVFEIHRKNLWTNKIRSKSTIFHFRNQKSWDWRIQHKNFDVQKNEMPRWYRNSLRWIFEIFGTIQPKYMRKLILLTNPHTMQTTKLNELLKLLKISNSLSEHS